MSFRKTHETGYRKKVIFHDEGFETKVYDSKGTLISLKYEKF
jgi:hypothetical protein